jgi:hypothetical protein
MAVSLKYRNKPAILMATGPSLTEEVIETIRSYKDKYAIFGCNDTYAVVDYLDEHYACDTAWWNYHGAKVIRKYPNSWTQCKNSAEKFKLNYIAGRTVRGLSLDSNLIHYGSNSGYQQLNIAFLMGCSKFILVGYNMGVPEGKQKHYFGDHPTGVNRSSTYDKFIKAYNTIQPEIKELIINCTPDSALTTFKYNDLEKELIL